MFTFMYVFSSSLKSPDQDEAIKFAITFTMSAHDQTTAKELSQAEAEFTVRVNV